MFSLDEMVVVRGIPSLSAILSTSPASEPVSLVSSAAGPIAKQPVITHYKAI